MDSNNLWGCVLCWISEWVRPDLLSEANRRMQVFQLCIYLLLSWWLFNNIISHKFDRNLYYLHQLWLVTKLFQFGKICQIFEDWPSANVDGNNGNWMDRYQSTLQEASSTLLSRTVLTSSTDPVSVDDCAAFCHLASTDCSLYTFDPSGSVCYVGLLESSGGSYAGPAGPTIVTLDHGLWRYSQQLGLAWRHFYILYSETRNYSDQYLWSTGFGWTHLEYCRLPDNHSGFWSIPGARLWSLLLFGQCPALFWIHCWQLGLSSVWLQHSSGSHIPSSQDNADQFWLVLYIEIDARLCITYVLSCSSFGFLEGSFYQ